MTLENYNNLINAKRFRVGHNATHFILEYSGTGETAGDEHTHAVVFTPSMAQELHTVLATSLQEHALLLATLARRHH